MRRSATLGDYFCCILAAAGRQPPPANPFPKPLKDARVTPLLGRRGWEKANPEPVVSLQGTPFCEPPDISILGSLFGFSGPSFSLENAGNIWVHAEGVALCERVCFCFQAASKRPL